MHITVENIIDSGDNSIYDVRSKAPGASGTLPLTAEMLLSRPSGDLFGWAMNVGMGWAPEEMGGKELADLGKRLGSEERDCPICDEQDLYIAAGDLTRGLLAGALNAAPTEPPKAVPSATLAPANPVLTAPPTPRTEPDRAGNAGAYLGVALVTAGLAAVVVGAYYIGVDGDRDLSPLSDDDGGKAGSDRVAAPPHALGPCFALVIGFELRLVALEDAIHVGLLSQG